MSTTRLQQSQVSGSLSYNDNVGRSDLFKANRSLADDLNSLRTQVKGILGTQTWMDEQALSLSNLKAQLTGTLSANNVAAAGTLSVAGAATVGGILDVNNTISASAIKIDWDVAQRLYIVDSDGSLKDEAKLVFNGSKLTVTGSFESTGNALVNALTASNGINVSAGGLSIAGDRLYVDGTLGVTGVSNFASVYASGLAGISGSLTVAGATSLKSGLNVTGSMSGSGALQVGGAATVAGILDVNNTISASALKIDGDVAQRLYIVDADGSLKDEANMVFDGSAFKVTGSISGSGAMQAGGALTVGGAAAFNSSMSVAGAAAFNSSMTLTGSFAMTGSMDVSGSALFRNGLEIAGDALEITGSFAVTGSTSFDGSVKLVGDVAKRLYIVGDDGAVKDEAKLVFNGSTLFVTGGLDVSSGLTVAGVTVNTSVADFNAGITADVIKIDGDVAQRLYIVGASGELNDEEKLTFNGSAFKVTGVVSGSGNFQAGGSLAVAGAASLSSTLGVTGLATLNNGLTVNSAAADFNAGITANEIKIDSDVAQRLYIVGASGELNDEEKLTFDGSAFKVTGAVSGSGNFQAGGTLTVAGAASLNSTLAVAGAADLNGALDVAGQVDLAASGVATNVRGTLSVAQAANFSNNVVVAGDLFVNGTTTYINTSEVRVADAFMYLATGSLGTTDSGIVLHGGAGVGMDLVMGQDGGAGEFIFGKGSRGPDGNGEMDGIELVPAWMSELKLGSQEGLFSGSLALSGSDLKVKSASGALKLVAFGDEEFSVAADTQMSAFQTQFGSSTTLVGAILGLAGVGGASSFRKGKISGSAISTQYGGTLDFSSVGALRATGDAAAGMDVYLNGVLLVQGDDYTVAAVDEITFVAGFRVVADDSIVVVIRNAAL